MNRFNNVKLLLEQPENSFYEALDTFKQRKRPLFKA